MSLTIPPRPEIRSLLIAFTDFEGYKQIASRQGDALTTFSLMDQLFCLIGREVESAGGHFVKTMGDGSLCLFDAAAADAGVQALLRAKAAVETHLAGFGFHNRMRVTAHVGEAALGRCGPHNLPDALGDEVNRCAGLGSGAYRGELLISPEAFRKLSPETRKSFRRHIRETVYQAASGGE